MFAPVALRAALLALPAHKYRRTLYRVVRPKFLAPPNRPLSGIGAKTLGARFTPKGSFEAIYFGEDPHTAFIEYHHEHLTLMRDKDDDFAFRLAVTATVSPHVMLDHGRILDLTRREVRMALGTTLNELASVWRVLPGVPTPPTHILGQEVYNSGLFQAIRYFSVRNPGGVCLAVFVDKLTAPWFIDLDDSKNGGPVQRIP